MATFRENMIIRAKAIAAELAAMDTTKIGGAPNVTASDGGTSVDNVGYKKALYEELETMFKILGISTVEELEALDSATTDDSTKVFEVETQLEL